MYRKIKINLIIIVIFTLIFLPPAIAQSTSVPDGLQFEINNNTIAITRYTGTAQTLVIPDQIQGLPVTEIRSSAFRSSLLTSVAIPASVIEVGGYRDNSTGSGAFDGAPLTNIIVDINNPVYSSIDGVLFDKSMQKLITYPKGRQSNTYVIPSSVIEIGAGAFDSISSLKSINVDDNNLVYASIDGVLFDKNTQILFKYPEGKRQLHMLYHHLLQKYLILHFIELA